MGSLGKTAKVSFTFSHTPVQKTVLPSSLSNSGYSHFFDL